MSTAQRQRIVFFGAGAFGLPTLEALSAIHEVVAVVTQPDRPAGRGRAPAPTPIGAWAREHLAAERTLQPESVNEAGARAQIRALEADAWVVIAFGQKLGRELLEGRFAVNLHASLLPRWRGAAPINAAILAGDLETGNSVITLAERMDAGMVLGQSRRRIDPALTAGDLHDLLSGDGPALVLDVLERQAAGRLEGREQDASRVTVAPKLSKRDGWIDFAESAEAGRRRIHGLTPWPGVGVGFRGERLKLLRAQVAGEIPNDLAPGTIGDAAGGVVVCGAGGLRLVEVQPAGGRAMTWAEFARGRRVEAGDRLEGAWEQGS